MGTCSGKTKRNVSTRAAKHKQRDLQPIVPTSCSYCNMRFPPETTLAAYNSHTESCLGAVDEIGALRSSAAANVPRASGRISCNPNARKNNEPFLWVKKRAGSNRYVWVKQLSRIGTGEKVSANLSIGEIEKLGFEEKRTWFRNGLDLLRIPWVYGADYLRVERSSLLESSVKGFEACNLYKGDEKVNDAGGLMREWMSLVIQEVVKPEIGNLQLMSAYDDDAKNSTGLFIKSESEEISYTINPKTPDTEEKLKVYEFAGKVVGKAIFERITIDIHFDDCMLKVISSKEPTLEDLKSLDYALYNSLTYLQNNTIGGSDIFQEYFVVPDRGDKTIELCPQGAHKLVTDNNKHEYIKLMVEWYGKKRIQKKLSAFKDGITSCIPIETLSVFEPRELEMIINGVPFIDIHDWENNTIYKGSYHKNHQVITWFWNIVGDMTQEDQAKLLQFCTGSSRTPVEGFRALESNRGSFAKFCIESIKYTKGQSLITAHTCFNRLVLPIYPSEEVLKKEIFNTIRSDFKGVFGLD